MRNFITKNIVARGLVVALLSATLSQALAAGSALKTLQRHVPSVTSQLQAKGRLGSTNVLNLALGLSLRNTQELTNLLERIYDPASPDYHHYLTPAEFTAQFGPTEQEYQAAIDFARTHGLEIVRTHSNRMVLDVRGHVSDVEGALNLRIKTYRHPTEARDFFAPDVDPSVPATLSIQDISGLDSYRRPHPKIKFKTNGQQPATTTGNSSIVTPNAGSGPGGNYVGNDFRTTYVPGTALNGSGQTIALVQFDGYLASDILAYETLVGRTNIPLQNVLLDGFNGIPTGNANNPGGEVEVSLDIEMVISMAPALSKVIVYEGDPFNFHPNDVLNSIATDNAARQISCSWGWVGGPTVTTDQIFKQMAVQGQTFYTASGDGDAYAAGSVDNPFGFGTPSDSAYLTSVGATTLTTSGPAYASETVWNWGIRFGPSFDGIGSSGAISTYYAIPYWQTNINMTSSQGSTISRNMPDVALTGDDVFVIADGGTQYFGVGGTSCAAPLWAGFTALVNQQAAINGHTPVGFINPALYTIANGPNYTNCFHDITTGNNKWSGSPNLFNAVPGYDLCTGLGTPNGTNLINALVSPSLTNPVIHFSPPPAPYGTTLASLNGSNPNGNWMLFIQDNAQPDGGVISNGWVLTLTTANPVGFAADLAVTKAASSGNVMVGSNLVYFITVTNYGPSSSSNVLVSDDLPSGLNLISSNATAGSVMRNGSTVIWNVGTLVTNSGAALTLTVHTSISGTIVNSVVSSSDTPDPNPDDNVASATVTVGALSPPQISGAATLSGTFQFSITSLPGQTNIIQASTNLANPAGWVPIYTNIGSFLFTDPKATNYPYRFYRDLLIGP